MNVTPKIDRYKAMYRASIDLQGNTLSSIFDELMLRYMDYAVLQSDVTSRLYKKGVDIEPNESWFELSAPYDRYILIKALHKDLYDTIIITDTQITIETNGTPQLYSHYFTDITVSTFNIEGYQLIISFDKIYFNRYVLGYVILNDMNEIFFELELNTPSVLKKKYSIAMITGLINTTNNYDIASSYSKFTVSNISPKYGGIQFKSKHGITNEQEAIKNITLLIQTYVDMYDTVLKRYKPYNIPNLNKQLYIKESGDKDLQRLQEALPQAFVTTGTDKSYSRLCSSDRRPKLVSNITQEDIDNHYAMIFDGIPLSCKHNKDKPYIGFSKNTTSTSDLYEELPCCFNKIKKPAPEPRFPLKSVYINKQKDMIINYRLGVLHYDLISILYMSLNSKPPETTNQKYLNLGTMLSPSSLIYALEMGVNTRDFINARDQTEYVLTKRKELLNYIETPIINASMQELYGLTRDQIRDNIENEQYVINTRYIKFLEQVYGVNIIVFKVDDAVNVDVPLQYYYSVSDIDTSKPNLFLINTVNNKYKDYYTLLIEYERYNDITVKKSNNNFTFEQNDNTGILLQFYYNRYQYMVHEYGRGWVVPKHYTIPNGWTIALQQLDKHGRAIGFILQQSNNLVYAILQVPISPLPIDLVTEHMQIHNDESIISNMRDYSGIYFVTGDVLVKPYHLIHNVSRIQYYEKSARLLHAYARLLGKGFKYTINDNVIYDIRSNRFDTANSTFCKDSVLIVPSKDIVQRLIFTIDTVQSDTVYEYKNGNVIPEYYRYISDFVSQVYDDDTLLTSDINVYTVNTNFTPRYSDVSYSQYVQSGVDLVKISDVYNREYDYAINVSNEYLESNIDYGKSKIETKNIQGNVYTVLNQEIDIPAAFSTNEQYFAVLK